MKEFQHHTAVTLANAIELTVGAVHELAPEIAKKADGSQTTRASLAHLVTARFSATFSKIRAKSQEMTR